MTRLILPVTAFAGLAMTASAIAADLPIKAPAYAPPAVALYNWTGFYVGANAGVSAGFDPLDQSTAFPPFPPGIDNRSSHDPFGALGGVQAGYNWQAGHVVLGVEGDVQLSGQRSDKSCLTFCDFNFQNPSALQFDGVSQSIPWFATLRGRIGYAAGPALFYATAGLAVADIKTNYSTTEIVDFDGTASTTRFGLAVGGGIEAALFGNWTAKVEYLYLDYGNVSSTFSYGGVGFFGPFSVISTVSGPVRDHVARAGLNYRFGDPAPAAVATMPTKAPPALPVAYNWSGFYVGGNGGYGVGRDPTEEDTFGLFGQGHQALTLVPSGPLGGVQAGYNTAPTNWLVLGVEADYQVADQKDTACISWCFAANTTYAQSIHWLATARGRAGSWPAPRCSMRPEAPHGPRSRRRRARSIPLRPTV